MAGVSKKSLTFTVLFTYYMKGLEEEKWKMTKKRNRKNNSKRKHGGIKEHD